MRTDTDDLIKKLSGDLTPVKPLMPAPLRAACVCVFSLLAVLGSITLFTRGMRPDLAAKLLETGYLIETIAMFAAGVLAATAACKLSVPDTKIRLPVYIMIGMASFIWIGMALSMLSQGAYYHVETGEHDCLSDLTLLLVAPVAALCFLVTRGAPIWRGWAGYSMMLAGGSFAAIGMRCLCGNDMPGHLLVWHFLPVLALAFVGIALGKILLKLRIAKN